MSLHKLISLLVAVALCTPPARATSTIATASYAEPCDELLSAAAKGQLPAHFVRAAMTPEQKRLLLRDFGQIDGPAFLKAAQLAFGDLNGPLSFRSIRRVLNDPGAMDAIAVRAQEHLTAMAIEGRDAAADRVSFQAARDLWTEIDRAGLTSEYGRVIADGIRQTLETTAAEFQDARHDVRADRLDRTIYFWMANAGFFFLVGGALGFVAHDKDQGVDAGLILMVANAVLMLLWVCMGVGLGALALKGKNLAKEQKALVRRLTAPKEKFQKFEVAARGQRLPIADLHSLTPDSTFTLPSLAEAPKFDRLNPVEVAYLGHRDLIKLQGSARAATGIDPHRLAKAANQVRLGARALISAPTSLAHRFQLTTALNQLDELLVRKVDEPWREFETDVNQMADRIDEVVRTAHAATSIAAELQASYLILLTRVEHDLKPIVSRAYPIPDLKNASALLSGLIEKMRRPDSAKIDWRAFAERTILTLDRLNLEHVFTTYDGAAS